MFSWEEDIKGFQKMDFGCGISGKKTHEAYMKHNRPNCLPSQTVLQPGAKTQGFCVATLSVTFSYQIYNIDKISKQSQWMSWMLVPSETGCCQHYLPTAKQQAVQELLIDYLSSGQGVEDELGKDVDWYW